ncbi:hypothetical protein ACEWX3_07595 [Mycobacterium sp. G7A2]|uniref:hypothetical protein n=1 Tax=Mycobacterium sp. G7A2 TaxID=3317307 RepID=UPI0035A837D1
MRLVEIEFTKDTYAKDEHGLEVPQRHKGQRVRVDPMSARSFVDVKKVAKLVGKPEERKQAKAAVKAVPEPEPEPEQEPAPEGDSA